MSKVQTRSAPEPRSRWSRRGLMALIAILEFAWLGWFLIEPLPNANNTGLPLGERVRRIYFVLKALPEVVPDTPFRESMLGQGLRELSHFENLPQRTSVVLAMGLIAAAAIGLGDLAARGLKVAGRLNLPERLALDYGLGAAVLGSLTLIVGRMGWLSPWTFRIGLAAIAAAGLGTSRIGSARRPQLGRWGWLALVLVAPFLTIMILGSMLPAIDFDVIEYHLQGPKEYYQAGRIAFLPHNVYTSMPFGIEMLHLMGMEILDDWWWGAIVGQLAVALFAPATAVLIAAATARIASPRAAAIAAIVYLSTPWVYRLAVIAYVEGPLCFYHAALVWGLVMGLWPGVSRSSVWGLLGLLAGAAMGCKYPALISAVIPFGAIALLESARRRSARPLLVYAAGWAIVIGPWLVKNMVDTGNPVYPLADGVFHSRLWNPDREAKWVNVHGPRKIRAVDLWPSVVDVAGRSDWQSPLYVALAPLAFLRPGSRRFALWLAGYAAYLFLTWWLLTHRLDRFWLPILPALAVLAGLGADWSTRWGWLVSRGLVLAFALFTNLTYVSTALAGLNEWTGDVRFLRDDIPKRLNPPLARLDAELAPDAKILLVGQASVFHLRHRIVYNTVFDLETIETLSSGVDPEVFRARLKERGITHVYVDWHEIDRYRQPGNYGFTSYVVPARFREWVGAGVLTGPTPIGPEQDLYTVR